MSLSLPHHIGTGRFLKAWSPYRTVDHRDLQLLSYPKIAEARQSKYAPKRRSKVYAGRVLPQLPLSFANDLNPH
jgi:hypothetical protein